MPNLRNFEDILRGMYTRMTTGHKAIGHEIITLSDGNVHSLTVPTDARYALMVLEETGGTGTAKLIRFWEDGSNPTTTTGIVRGDMDAWDVVSYANLKSFKIIRLTASAHKLFVQYYS
jgi:hypothetical protein